MTIREALTKACAGLKQAGLESPNLDSSLLLAKVLNTSRTTLAACAAEPLSHEANIAFNVLIKRRLKGECIAYILGKKEFRGLEFLVNPSVLVPRPDTETLVETAVAIIKEQMKEKIKNDITSNNLNVLDLCTGSGAVAVSLKYEMPDIEVYAADISRQAIETAKANAAKLLQENNIHFYQGDLYSALHSDSPSAEISHFSILIPRFSLIVSNPPYIPSDIIKTLPAEVQNEPLIALDGGESGLEVIKRIIDGAPEHLKPAGILAMEADPSQMEKITVLLEKRGFINIIIYKDLSGQKRVITGKYNLPDNSNDEI